MTLDAVQAGFLDILCPVLGTDPSHVDLTVSFLDAGGDSLKAIMAMANIEETYGFTVSIESFVDAESLQVLLGRWQTEYDASQASS